MKKPLPNYLDSGS